MIRQMQIAIVATGKMGEAVAAGLVRAGVPAQQIVASNRRQARLDELAARHGVRVTLDNAEAARGAQVVVVCCKPQTFDAIAADIKDAIDAGALVVSVMAGVSTNRLRWSLGHERVVRAMPNLPGTIGAGISVWYATPATLGEQHAVAAQVLASLGDEVQVNEENYLDMATALSGTGPAYLFMLMEALIDAGVHMGFSRHMSQKLVERTLAGSVEYAIRTQDHPVTLRNAVTSPGGTTAAALYEMERGRIRTVLADAVHAAWRRSVELGLAHRPGESEPKAARGTARVDKRDD
ncbi:MAG: pyrroline-5-carboxylate reductase [Planctomycetota bacterium]